MVPTFRNERPKAVADLEKHGIRFTDLVLVDSFETKAEVIAERGIGFYIDERPAALRNIPPNGSVLLFRNEGNFDFEGRKWMFSEQTGKLK